jgi:hypothetical protein
MKVKQFAKLAYAVARAAVGVMGTGCIPMNPFPSPGEVTLAQDFDADGAPDRIDIYGYDDAGRRVKWVEDFNGDGKADKITNYAYDADGRLLSTTWDDNGDGFAESIQSHQYDTNGRRSITSLDGGLPSTSIGLLLEYVRRYAYDGGGNLVGIDENGISRTEFLCDFEGRRTYASFDMLKDGFPEGSVTYAYDSMGNLLLREKDYNGDGLPERVDRYTYDASGKIIEHAIDDDGGRNTPADGIDNILETLRYTVSGMLAFTGVDRDADGNVDYSRTYMYNGQGLLHTVEEDIDGDGLVDYVEAYAYDQDGRLTTKEFDYDRDGAADATESFVYGGQGNLERYTYLLKPNDDVVNSTIYSYTRAGDF